MTKWPETGLDLTCYPSVPEHIARPWDAADEYLIKHSEGSTALATNATWLLINDRQGALSCALPNSISWADEACAIEAAKSNRAQNKLPAPGFIEQPSELTALSDIDLHKIKVAIKIPKNLELLKYWLTVCQQVLPPQTEYWLAGMAKYIPIPWLKWLEANSSQYKQHPIVKKARLIQLTPQPTLQPNRDEQLAMWQGYSLGSLRFEALPGVFSRQSPDIGGRFLLEQCNNIGDDWFQGHLCDLGCGNGLLGISLASRYPSLKVTMTDNSALAIKSARKNAERANIDVAFAHGDCLQKVEGTLDRIVCNPPFHDGHIQLTNIAEQMFSEAAERLVENGEMLVVANRHLPYSKLLKRYFGLVEQVSQNNKFVIFQCSKPEQRTQKGSKRKRSDAR